MNVAIIGTGNVGSALGASFSRAGHNVVFTARDNDKAAAVAAERNAVSEPSTTLAVKDADIVVLAVPYASVMVVADEIAPVAAGKIVIDTTNPLKPDFSGLATSGGPSVAEQLAETLAGAYVVKAFNTVFSSIQAEPKSSGTPTPDALFATDDEHARATFQQLATSIGFRPVWVGPLSAARELESVAMLNIRLQLVNGGAWNTSVKLIDPPAKAIAA